MWLPRGWNATSSCPPTSETSPLLGNSNVRSDSWSCKILRVIKADGEPSWAESFKFILFGSWANILLLFVPLSIVSHHLRWDAALRFIFSFVAIIPLAKLLGEATDQLSIKLGQTLSGLLNASFGNAVEIIIGIAALLNGELRLVQTSMLGSILSNILLVLGCSFLAGGFYYSEGSFNLTGAQASASLMTLSCITLVIPAAYASTTRSGLPELPCDIPDDKGGCPSPGLLAISRGTAVLLLFVYCAYLVFQLYTHPQFFRLSLPDEDEEETSSHMNMMAAASSLLLVTIATAFCAEYLVASIEETAQRYHIPKAFIGVILLPIVGNAAEHVTSVWMALKNKYELTISICVGSSIQISALVIPLLVIVGWIVGQPLTLHFENFETIVLFVSVLLVSLLIMDGKTNYMEGLMLTTLYLVIALAFWVTTE
ncbi:calcium proton exchanger [Pisolithus sp. B1]|nr:calcium proton exchanger [Pisolithus sp. B1]